MVEDLGSKVENGTLLGGDDLLNGLLGQLSVGLGSGVELHNVALVMLVVVIGDLLLGKALGGEGIVSPGKRGDAEGH